MKCRASLSLSASCTKKGVTPEISKLRTRSERGKDKLEHKVKLLDAEINDLKDEETRLLGAYREKVISMDQLKQQMATVQEKRAPVEEGGRSSCICVHVTSMLWPPGGDSENLISIMLDTPFRTQTGRQSSGF